MPSSAETIATPFKCYREINMTQHSGTSIQHPDRPSENVFQTALGFIHHPPASKLLRAKVCLQDEKRSRRVLSQHCRVIKDKQIQGILRSKSSDR
jgi:hypothetical protein